MRTLLALTMILVATVAAADDTPSAVHAIRGHVFNAETGDPVAEAEVLLASTAQSAFTDAEGYFELKRLLPGEYEVIAFAFGMRSISQAVRIQNSDANLEFQLVPINIDLNEYTVEANAESNFGITRLRPVEGTAIYAGKKSEVVVLDEAPANLATNNSRQVYARVSGLNIWESDGAGIQLGIGGRGLNPNRVSNFNTRQNGYDISADALGYPESYYSPPTAAIDRIEIVRGAASLQYGTQFGGFINFKLKEGPEDKPIEVQSRQTYGSFGLYSSFNSVGGTKGKVNYYTFYQYKRGNGWRPNEHFNVHTTFGSVRYKATKKLTLSADYTFMHYLAQQPGGLTDAMFTADPRQSIRERNWFAVDWNLAAITLDYRFSSRAELNWRTFGLHAGRHALGILGQINRADPGTERDLLSDRFNNLGSELRFVQRYNLKGMSAVWLIGARAYSGHTKRLQGLGSAGSDADFAYQNSDAPEHSAYLFPSKNLALFTENVVFLNEHFTLTPGARFELIDTRSDGYYNLQATDLAGNVILEQQIEDQRHSQRHFFLFGLGASYKPGDRLEFYGNISENYRSINFNDMRVVNPNFEVDPNLMDERGFSSDLGVRGSYGNKLNFDVSLFLLQYRDRIGLVLEKDPETARTFLLRTNIADSRNYGIETFVEADLFQVFKPGKYKAALTLFSNASLMDARYFHSQEAAFDGNKVELVPNVIVKCGTAYKRNGLRAAAQVSYTSRHFTDATNATFTPSAVYGEIPAYYVADFSIDYTFKRYTLASGVNNLTNNSYFTRRASGYPGPGIIPASGRNYYVSVGVKI